MLLCRASSRAAHVGCHIYSGDSVKWHLMGEVTCSLLDEPWRSHPLCVNPVMSGHCSFMGFLEEFLAWLSSALHPLWDTYQNTAGLGKRGRVLLSQEKMS